jgi:hypothetical protein
MNTTAPQSPLLSALDSDDAKEPQGEALSAFPGVITDTWVERDCLCGTFTVRDGLFATPVNAIKS